MWMRASNDGEEEKNGGRMGTRGAWESTWNRKIVKSIRRSALNLLFV